MNVNDMIDTILNFDLDVVLAGLNESSHHLSQMEFISLIVITAVAVLLCLTGLKLVRFWSVIAGLSAGCAAGIAVWIRRSHWRQEQVWDLYWRCLVHGRSRLVDL